MPLLSSDVDGERLATTAAIERVMSVLGSTGMTLPLPLPKSPTQPQPAPQRAPEPQLRPHPGGGYEIAAGDLMSIIQEVRERVFYSPWRANFSPAWKPQLSLRHDLPFGEAGDGYRQTIERIPA